MGIFSEVVIFPKPNQRILRTPSASEGELVSMDCFSEVEIFPEAAPTILENSFGLCGEALPPQLHVFFGALHVGVGGGRGHGIRSSAPPGSLPRKLLGKFPRKLPKNLPRNRFCFDLI